MMLKEKHITEDIIKARISLLENYGKRTDEILQKAIDEISRLTESPIGFFHFFDTDQNSISLQAWSTRTLNEFCTTEGRGLHYSLDKAGVWADCVRTGGPVIHNDYKALAVKKGLPEGHAPLIRELVIPIKKAERIVAIIGVGNKPEDYDQRDVEIVSFLSDVTWELVSKKEAENAIRISEARLARAELVSNTGNWEMHLDTEKVFASRGAMRIYGISSGTVPYDDIKKVPLKEYRSPLDNAMKMLIEQNVPYDIEYEILTVDSGEHKYIHSIAKYNKEDKIVFGVIKDITGRKNDEMVLLDLNKRLQELNETKDKLWSVIAHDLRSPFNGILGITELLIDNIDTYTKEKIKMFLQEIDSATKHTLSFLDNLLTWAKAQTGQIEFKPDSYDLDQIIRETISLYNSQLNLKKISLFYTTCNKMVYADRDMLQTILRNLISNAIKFTGESGQIDILCNFDGNNAKITVRDNGTGINEAACEGLFKLNSQPGSTGSGEKQNSGLGLLICREFVERHGGQISVKSEPGKGSEFMVDLPYRK